MMIIYKDLVYVQKKYLFIFVGRDIDIERDTNIESSAH